MKDLSIEKLAELISAILKRAEKRFLLLVTASDKDEKIIIGELERLMQSYPECRICLDESAAEMYSGIFRNSICSAKLLDSKREIRKEVSLADGIAAITFDLSTMSKVSMGLDDSKSAFVIMEALLQNKMIVASDDEFRNRLTGCADSYRLHFQHAKAKTESYGMAYCQMHMIKSYLENHDVIEEPEIVRPAECRPEKKQVVTLQDLMENENLSIAEDAIITPAAKEILIGKKL